MSDQQDRQDSLQQSLLARLLRHPSRQHRLCRRIRPLCHARRRGLWEERYRLCLRRLLAARLGPATRLGTPELETV
ncbi:hypothetical protein PGT21_015136 [Puccinia graminis f. sp. tritici]|uniref:Uncharacterized protein n=1 Tax=Puccinia graminis f. sp. tritici TaxID=56615 RepID=A0A5B0PR79_PUCGR|nr:hypothetical protein PGT21_015136 [Puccinia graminis f. sp. tritici]